MGAEVHMLDGGPLRQDEVIRTGQGGTFHLDRLDPDAPLSLSARTTLATSDGPLTVRPADVKEKLTLTIDPRFACQIRGVATDPNGNRIPGGHGSRYGGAGHTPHPGMITQGFPSLSSASS